MAIPRGLAGARRPVAGACDRCTDLRSYSGAVVSGEPAEPDESGSEVPVDIREVSFPVSVRGYDRGAVDAYVTRVNRLIAELEVTRSPEAAVKQALEQVGEQTSGILQRAGETAEEIAAAARQKAEESTARARKEAEETVAKARRDAEETLGRAKAEAAEHLKRSGEEVTALREEAEARLRELHADTETIWEERRELLDDIREIAARVEEAANGADARFPLREPAESALEAVVETGPEAGTEEGGVGAAGGPHDDRADRNVRPGG
jgi:DivIVA domain-containing protein